MPKYIITDSKAIRAIEWEDENLTITFTDGRNVTYLGVPKKVFDEMMEAKSTGLYFNHHVRDRYQVQK